MREPSRSDIEKDHRNVSLNPRTERISKSPTRAGLSFSPWGKNCQTSLQLTPLPPGGDRAPQEDTLSAPPGPTREQDTPHPQKAAGGPFASPDSFLCFKSATKTPPRAVNKL